MDYWLICQHTENCKIYKNFAEQARKERIDIIEKNSLFNKYDGLALNFLSDSDPVAKEGILIMNNLKNMIEQKDNFRNIKCSHIEKLNLLEKRSSKLDNN